MNDKHNPIVSCNIGGLSRQLRWDKAAMFRIGKYPEATEDIDTDNAAALFRRVITFAWAMQTGKRAFAEPEDLAAAMTDDETEPAMAAVIKAINAGKEGDTDADPLSASGPSPVTVSD
jgi:hypothetical protein